MKIKVFETPCENCLFSPDRIVSDDRAEEIIKKCLEKDFFFVCHKASERNYKEMTCCRSFFDRYQKAVLPLRLAVMFNAVEFIPQPETDSAWIIQPQEQNGTYRFEGACFATRNVKDEVSERELEQILQQIRLRVSQNKGADYLLVFKHSASERKIFVIDNLSAEMLCSDGYSEEEKREHNYFTIMFAEEY